MIARPLHIAVSGGKGGTGKSSFARNLAIFYAQIGNRTALLDFSESCGSLASLSGTRGWKLDSKDRLVRQRTEMEKFVMLHAPQEAGELASLLEFEKEEKRFDVMIADVPPARCDGLPGVFLLADIPVVVVTPEPEALIETCELVSRLLFGLIERESDGRWTHADLACAVPDRHRATWFLTPRDIFASLVDEDLMEFMRKILNEVAVGVVVSGAGTRGELELGPRLESFARKVFSLPLVYVGAVEHDEKVAECSKAGRAFILSEPDSRASTDLQRIARRFISCPSIKLIRPPWKLGMDGDENFYELLQVSYASPSYDIKKSYESLARLFSVDFPLMPYVRRRESLAGLERLLREAFDTLYDKNRRAEYNVMLGSVLQVDVETEDDDVLAEEVEHAAKMDRARAPREKMSGLFIRQTREGMGLSFHDIASATKIGVQYLRAIEEENYVDLPEPVYVKGFLKEIARILEIDPEQLAQAYLRRMRDGNRER
jgi:MinD-like ATPase involved in chromosome partitioning or flagellar assembly